MLSPYDSRTEETRNKIQEGRTSYYVNKYYKNSTYNFYWYINQRGYIHIVKPCKINFDGHFSHYEIDDILLKADDMTTSNSRGFYKTKEDCIQAIEKNLAKDNKQNNDIKLISQMENQYSITYAGDYKEKFFVIDINKDMTIGIEYDLKAGEFTDDEIEALANKILDIVA